MQVFTDAIYLEGNAQGSVAMSTTGAQSAAPVDNGFYDVWSTVDCYIKVATTADDVTTATGYLLRANNTVTVFLKAGRKLGAIVASGTGTLYYHKVAG